MDFYLYIDWGSGYALLDPNDVDINLGFKVDENINPGIKRSSCNGSFKLLDSDYDNAFTYFVTNGSVNAPFRIYENGILGVGVLKFQGFANVNEDFNIRESLVTFNTFSTDDDYDPVLAVWNDETTIVESLSLSNDFRSFYIQGGNINCSKLRAYSLSGSTWASTGNALALGDVGRIAMDTLGSGVVVYDNLTQHLHRYVWSSPNWSGATLGTTLDLSSAIGNLVGNGAIAAISSTRIAFVEDGYNSLYFLTMTTGTFTLDSTHEIEDISKPSVAFLDSVNGYIAIVDNGTKVLRCYSISTGTQIGNTLSLGDLINPDICLLDAANARIALTDIKTNTIRCYEFDGTNFNALGTHGKLGVMYEPKMTAESVNNITIIDAIGGFMARYAFSGTAWSQTGSDTTISGGYMAGCGYQGSVMGVVQADNLAMQTSRCVSYFELTNAVLSDLSLGLSIPSSGHGATFDMTKVYFGEMDNLSERNSEPIKINYTKWRLKDLLQFAEIFQNYWYIDGVNIKFKQPADFSSVGINFSISSLTRGGLYVKTENNQEKYLEGFNVSKERMVFQNERDIEFIGLPIDYGRNNENEIIYPFPYTADFEFIYDYFTNQTQNLSLSGQFIAAIELDATSGYYVASDTGELSGNNTRNAELSKAWIMEYFWKDYRYTADANFTLNGNSVAPQDTAKRIVDYPALELDYSDLGITELPASAGNLTWDTGKVGYIYSFFVNLYSKIITIETGRLDL